MTVFIVVFPVVFLYLRTGMIDSFDVNRFHQLFAVFVTHCVPSIEGCSMLSQVCEFILIQSRNDCRDLLVIGDITEVQTNLSHNVVFSAWDRPQPTRTLSGVVRSK